MAGKPETKNQKSTAKMESYPAVSVKEDVTQIQDKPQNLETLSPPTLYVNKIISD